jgi:hypothetical protein
VSPGSGSRGPPSPRWGGGRPLTRPRRPPSPTEWRTRRRTCSRLRPRPGHGGRRAVTERRAVLACAPILDRANARRATGGQTEAIGGALEERAAARRVEIGPRLLSVSADHAARLPTARWRAADRSDLRLDPLPPEGARERGDRAARPAPRSAPHLRSGNACGRGVARRCAQAARSRRHPDSGPRLRPPRARGSPRRRGPGGVRDLERGREVTTGPAGRAEAPAA